MSKLKEKNTHCPDLQILNEVLQELEAEEKEIKQKDEELKKKEKLTPWNVDTIGHDGFTKTVINVKTLVKNDESMLSEQEREKKMKKFVNDNEKLLKKYGMLQKYDDSKEFLLQNLHLVCENTANYLVIWCVNLEMEQVKYKHLKFYKISNKY